MCTYMHEQNEIGADRQIQFLFGCQTASLAHLINFHINITFRGMYVDISRRRQKERERERERKIIILMHTFVHSLS
jgi:hypothetical protein